MAPALRRLLQRLSVPSLVAATILVTTVLTASAASASHRTPAAMTMSAAGVQQKQPPSSEYAKRTTTVPMQVGLLAPTPTQLAALDPTVISRVVVPIGWDSFEPANGVFNPVAVADARARLQQAAAHGEQVVLDLGLQYPPSWVFGLPGQTRFVDQYGHEWHGVLSTDVPNAVFNTAVRAAEAKYLRFVGTVLTSSHIDAVRVGGLLSGELRYPPNAAGGSVDSLWDYDPAAQALSPKPGWRPGDGTSSDAAAALHFYLSSLTGYESWLMHQVHRAMPTVEQQVLLPGWGLRPGMTGLASATRLDGTSNAEVNDIIGSGLDWDNQVKVIAQSGYRATVYCTWIDAPTQGPGPLGEPPVAYLAALAARYGLPVAGENTGGGGVPALSLTLQRGRDYALSSVMYMSGDLIRDGGAGLDLATLQQVVGSSS